MAKNTTSALPLDAFLEAPAWISVAEASRLLGRTRSRVLQLIQEGRLRAKRLDSELSIGDGEFRIRRDDLLRVRRAYTVGGARLRHLSDELSRPDLAEMNGVEIQDAVGGDPPDNLAEDLLDQPMYEEEPQPLTPRVVAELTSGLIDSDPPPGTPLEERVRALEASLRSVMFVMGEPGSLEGFSPSECDGLMAQCRRQLSRSTPEASLRLARTLLRLSPEHVHSLEEWKRRWASQAEQYLGKSEEPYALLVWAARSIRHLLESEPGALISGTREAAAVYIARRAEAHVLRLAQNQAALNYALAQGQPRYVPAGLSRIDQAMLRYLGIG